MNPSNEFNVYPNINISKKIVKAAFKVCEYIPFTSAKISVILFDENDSGIDTRIFTLDETNGFSQWGADDTFLVNWLKTQIIQK